MNRYLLAGIAVACIGAEASENPFDLKKNLQNLDTEQSSMLTQLRKSAKSDQSLEDEPTKELNTTQQISVPENASEPAIKEKEVHVPEAASTVTQKPAIPEIQSEAVPAETNTSSQSTMQKAQPKEEPIAAEQAKSSEKIIIEIKPKEVNKSNIAKMQEEEKPIQQNGVQEIKLSLPTDNENSKRAVLKIEITDPQKKNSVLPTQIPTQNTTVNEDEIERIYLEAIKEVGAK